MRFRQAPRVVAWSNGNRSAPSPIIAWLPKPDNREQAANPGGVRLGRVID